MTILKKYTPQKEVELHQIIEKELASLEKGLSLLQREYSSGKGFIDFLCVDSGGRLTIIEVKLHEDENVLFQALRYFNDIARNIYLVSTLFQGKSIDPEQLPRLIIIAGRFSEDLKQLSTLFEPDIELYEYAVLETNAGERGIYYHPVSLPVIDRLPSEPATIENLIAYLTNKEVKLSLDVIRGEIKAIDSSIYEYATKSYIGFKHPNGRLIAYITVRRTAIEVGARIIDEEQQLITDESLRIEGRDENYSEIIEKIKISHKNLCK